jgi:hypothetical protein
MRAVTHINSVFNCKLLVDPLVVFASVGSDWVLDCMVAVSWSIWKLEEVTPLSEAAGQSAGNWLLRVCVCVYVWVCLCVYMWSKWMCVGLCVFVCVCGPSICVWDWCDCVCVYVYGYVSMCMMLRVYVCLYGVCLCMFFYVGSEYMCVWFYVCVCFVCLSLCMLDFVCVCCVWFCICIYVGFLLSVCVCGYMLICLCSTHVCLWVCKHMYVIRVRIYVFVRVYICRTEGLVYVCSLCTLVFVCVCFCVHASVCVCVFVYVVNHLSTKQHSPRYTCIHMHVYMYDKNDTCIVWVCICGYAYINMLCLYMCL